MPGWRRGLTAVNGALIAGCMDFELSEDQRAFQATARQFARDAMMPHARDWDEGEIFPVETLRKAAALGFGGIYVKEDVGGSDLSRLDATIIF
jgi:alkylation response protein AidB-like acyl-CoA dehydrogenase